MKNVVQQRGLARPEKTGEHRDRKFGVNLHEWCMLGCHIGKISCCRSASQSRPKQLLFQRRKKQCVCKASSTLSMSTPPMLPKGAPDPFFELVCIERYTAKPETTKKQNRLRATKWGHRCSRRSNRLEPRTKWRGQTVNHAQKLAAPTESDLKVYDVMRFKSVAKLEAKCVVATELR